MHLIRHCDLGVDGCTGTDAHEIAAGLLDPHADEGGGPLRFARASPTARAGPIPELAFCSLRPYCSLRSLTLLNFAQL